MPSLRSHVIQAIFANTGTGVWVLWSGLTGIPSALSPQTPFAERRLAKTLADYLWKPLGTVLALSILLGVTSGVLCATILDKFHVELAVTPRVANLLTSQVAPLIVGIFAAGRISVAIAVRFGAMQLQGEIDALVLRGEEPVRFLLAPVIASVVVTAPLLTIGASVAALLGTGLVLSVKAITPFADYLRQIVTPALAQGVLAGIVRSYVFLLLAVIAGAVAGTTPIVNLGDLGRRTMAAFTSGLLLIFAAFTALSLWK